MKLKPSRSATPSIDYPGPGGRSFMSPDDLDFECEVCRETFWMRPRDYDGRWDHPPNVPICPKCAEDSAEAAPHYITTQTETPCFCPECGKPMRRIGDYEFACGTPKAMTEDSMNDNVKRLRRLVGQEGIGPVELMLLARDSADEIERLRELLRETLQVGAYGRGSTLASRIAAALAPPT